MRSLVRTTCLNVELLALEDDVFATGLSKQSSTVTKEQVPWRDSKCHSFVNCQN